MKEAKKQEYEKYVKKVTPTHNLWLQMLKAFITGGIICTVGQAILTYATDTMQIDKQTAGSWCSLILVLISVLLTGLNIYPRIVKWGGAGRWFPSQVLPMPSPLRRWNSKRRALSSASVRRCSPLLGLSSSTASVPVWCMGLFTGSQHCFRNGFLPFFLFFKVP